MRKYYYPKTATEENPMLERLTLVTVPPLFYDPKRQAYYEPSVGERYLELQSADEFWILREEAQETLKQIENQTTANHSPIYYDLKARKYYYPKISMLEEEGEILRKILYRRKPMYWDPEMDSYVDPVSKLEYVMVESPTDYQKMKVDYREVVAGEEVEERAIYYDGVKDTYFYPAIALEGKQ